MRKNSKVCARALRGCGRAGEGVKFEIVQNEDGWRAKFVRVMAVDYGDRRTGIAVSDELGIMPGEAFVVAETSAERLAEAIAAEAEARGVTRIVVGLPKNMDGTVGPRAEKSLSLADTLRGRHGLDVVMWDERRTTVDAQRILAESGVRGRKKKGKVDAVAACLILEGYLGSLGRGGAG